MCWRLWASGSSVQSKVIDMVIVVVQNGPLAKVCWSILTPRVMVLGWWSSRLMEFQVDEEGRGLVDACVIQCVHGGVVEKSYNPI